ncbi:MAG: PQQ-binding-like beta-propeller repeat protein, partial [Planctomycetaceae bacterium]
MRRLPVVCFSVFTLCIAGPASAADWTQFRGPGGLATSADTGLPLKWSATENLVWRTRLPGAGSSSPIVLKDRVYLTCYSGYGLDDRDPGEQGKLMRHVVCLDRGTGKIVWKRDFKARLPETRYRRRLTLHGYATSTATTDGKHLYVFFGKSGVYCLKLEDGSQVWHVSVGDRTAGWGSANSPVLHDGVLIINASIESRSLVGLDKTTGKQLWKVDGIARSWSTPVLV